MKKIILTLFGVIFLCFLIPVIFTKGFKSTYVTSDDLNVNIEDGINDYNYSGYNVVKVLHTKTETVEEIGLDEYLLGVVAAEMPASFEIEALRAQAIAARTYTIYSIIHRKKHSDADICDSFSCCQAWMTKEERYAKWNEGEREHNWRKIVESVNSTQGKIITHNR